MKKRIHMIGNTHIDPVWLWNRSEGMQEVKSSFVSALCRLEEFEDFKFTQSSISFLAWMKENCPVEFEKIKEMVGKGRWEIAGGMWVEPDCNLPSGESLIRQFLYGKRFVLEEFGKDVVTTYNVDSFGHGANLPAICNGCGVPYYFMSRPGRSFVEAPPVFVWKSPDGSSVLAERTGGEYMAWTKPAIEFNLEDSLSQLEEYGYHTMAVCYGVGNHGGGPTIDNIRSIHEMIEEHQELKMTFSTLGEFFDSLNVKELPAVQKEMGRIYYGCYSSDKEIKEKNRKAEWILQKAEIMSCMAKQMGVSTYQVPKEKLDAAWKWVLQNQFHDILAGTSMEEGRNEACQEFALAISVGRAVIRDAIQAIANEIDTRGEGFPLILFNPTGTDFEDVYEAQVYMPRAMMKPLRLRDYKGREISYDVTEYENYSPENRKGILFQAKVPAYGYSIYRVIAEDCDKKEEAERIKATSNSLENGIVKVLFDKKTGCPSSIKTDGQELLEKPGSIRVYYDDRGAWGIDVYEEKLLGEFQVTECRILEENTMRAGIRFLLTYEKSEMMIDYFLKKDSDCLEIRMKLRNAEKNRQICMEFPVGVTEPKVVTETGFLAEQKVDCKHRNSEYYQHRFADVSKKGKGIAFLNDSVYGMRQVENTYKWILLRNSVFARGKGGPMEETLEGRFMNQGTYDYKFLCIPHVQEISQKKLFTKADFLHMPVEYLGDSNHGGRRYSFSDSALKVQGENAHISTIKCGYESEEYIIVRVFETEGKQGNFEFQALGHKVTGTLNAYQIKTYQVRKEGVHVCNLIEQVMEEK